MEFFCVCQISDDLFFAGNLDKNEDKTEEDHCLCHVPCGIDDIPM